MKVNSEYKSPEPIGNYNGKKCNLGIKETKSGILDQLDELLSKSREKISTHGEIEFFMEYLGNYCPERGGLIGKIGEKETHLGFVTRKNNFTEYIKFYSLESFGFNGEILEIVENDDRKSYYFVNGNIIDPIICLSGVERIMPKFDEFIENFLNGLPVVVINEDKSATIIIKDGGKINSKNIDSNDIGYNKKLYEDFINGNRGEKVWNNIIYFLNGNLIELKEKYYLTKDGKIKEKGIANKLKKGVSLNNIKDWCGGELYKYFGSIKYNFEEDINLKLIK